MNTRCTVCHHPQRAEIEQAHVAGVTLREIGKRFDRSKTTIAKHLKSHVPAAAQKALDAANDREVEAGDAILADADGSKPIVIARSVKGLSHIAWSPDGRFVAFSGSIDGGPGSGWIAPSDGSAPPATFTSIPGAWDPTWSPDGKRLLIGADPGLLYVVDRDGRNLQLLTKGHYQEVGQRGEIAEWSPDGALILFTAFVPGGQNQVYLVGLDGARERQLSMETVIARDASWSPDGSKIAYMRAGTGTGPTVFITDITGMPLRSPPGQFGWYQPIWSPDGTKIVVTE
jgi:tricorn protease